MISIWKFSVGHSFRRLFLDTREVCNLITNDLSFRAKLSRIDCQVHRCFPPRADYARRRPALGAGKAVDTPLRKSHEKISAAATTSDGLSAELLPSAGGDAMILSQRRKHGVHDFIHFIQFCTLKKRRSKSISDSPGVRPTPKCV